MEFEVQVNAINKEMNVDFENWHPPQTISITLHTRSKGVFTLRVVTIAPIEIYKVIFMAAMSSAR